VGWLVRRPLAPDDRIALSAVLTAREHYEGALSSLWLQRGDALQRAQAAIAVSPAFVPARLLEAALLVTSRDVRDFRMAAAAVAALQAVPMTHQEAMHAAALAVAAEGDFAGASTVYDRVLHDVPYDPVALWTANLVDYYLGNPQVMHARSARTLSHWPRSAPGYHAALSMHAFALAECGDYAGAEEAARQALALEPRDVRAEHALVHVFEMQGRAEEGIARLGGQRGTGPTGNHLLWHVALLELQLQRPDRALALYDARLGHDGLAQLIDASALLWRLRLAGVAIDRRFERLAERWSPHAEDVHCAFNDLHAMMAFAGARRWDLAERLLAAQERRLARAPGTNRDMTRLVGYPACRAIAAFGRGDLRGAEALLRGLPPVAHRIGGSHAQRDVLLLTRAAALHGPRSFRPAKGERHAFAPQPLAAA
jgi:tetratricopeptide (TPR) repeat protein